VFSNLSWEHILVLVVVGLVVLGPERLPGAIRWTSTALRQARDYLSGVTTQLREDLGPDFDDLRAPLGELQRLRGMSPRSVLTKHLLDGDDSFLTGNFDKPVSDKPVSDKPVSEKPVSGGGPTPVGSDGSPAAEAPRHGAAPFDSDAT
jgi:sec-independent protein translocase protein TatB